MKVFCLENFKEEFCKLKGKKAYKTLESDIIKYFFHKDIAELNSGTRLNQNAEAPYIKKRINGSGGFRFYFLILLKEENLYLMFVHPKNGPDGSSNITDESKALLLKKVHDSIINGDLLNVEVVDKTLFFKKNEKKEFV